MAKFAMHKDNGTFGSSVMDVGAGSGTRGAGAFGHTAHTYTGLLGFLEQYTCKTYPTQYISILNDT